MSDLISGLPMLDVAHPGATIENNDFAVRVELRREPAEAELEQLNRLIQSATAEFRSRLTSAG